MQAVWLVFAAGAAGSIGLWVVGRPLFDPPRWRATNYRGAELAGVSGTVVVLVGVAGIVVLQLLDRADLHPTHGYATLVAVLGFGLLGLLDDLGNDTSGGGFTGHLTALREGRVTTGFAKLLGGAVVAMVATAMFESAGPATAGDLLDVDGVLSVVRGGGLIALGANLLNLFDRAPGRATKVGIVWWCLLLALNWGSGAVSTAWAAATVGAAVGLLGSEIREQHMQGDTGVNASGAALGLATVAVAGPSAEWIVLAVLVALNLASERISFTSVIDQTRPLRWLDRIGSPFRA